MKEAKPARVVLKSNLCSIASRTQRAANRAFAAFRIGDFQYFGQRTPRRLLKQLHRCAKAADWNASGWDGARQDGKQRKRNSSTDEPDVFHNVKTILKGCASSEDATKKTRVTLQHPRPKAPARANHGQSNTSAEAKDPATGANAVPVANKRRRHDGDATDPPTAAAAATQRGSNAADDRPDAVASPTEQPTRPMSKAQAGVAVKLFEKRTVEINTADGPVIYTSGWDE